MLAQQSLLPPKLRLKATLILDIIGYYYSTMQSFLDRVGYFHDLPIDARRALIQHNSDTAGTYNSIFIVREANAVDNPDYLIGCCNIYGQENFNEFHKFLSKLEQNGTLVKIMLLIIAFSGNCSIVAPNHAETIDTISSTMPLIRIQNVLVTMLWKYLNYQYGFSGAVKCFNTFISFILNILRWTAERPVVQHWDMVDTIVENSARSLTIDDHD
jgi:hypothetical protein